MDFSHFNFVHKGYTELADGPVIKDHAITHTETGIAYAYDDQGRLVNRWDNVALIGGCTDANEVNYLLGKFRFALGIVAYENQARL